MAARYSEGCHLKVILALALYLLGSVWGYADQGGETGCGHILGGYRILKKLGDGTYGTVYEASRVVPVGPSKDQQVVALKRLKGEFEAEPGQPEPPEVQRFRHEFRLLSRFSPPNGSTSEIIQALEFRHVEWTDTTGKTHHTYFFTMEPFKGNNLDDLWSEEYPMSFAFVSKVGIQVAQAIEAMAAAGIVHGDIKPQNMVAMEHQGRVRVRLVDFGTARLLQADPFENFYRDNYVATWHYVAPEILTHRQLTDTQTDLYALGVSLYQLLTGKFPYRGKDEDATIRAISTGSQKHVRRANPEVPQSLAAVVDRLMARGRRERYRDPTDVIRDLTLALQEISPR